MIKKYLLALSGTVLISSAAVGFADATQFEKTAVVYASEDDEVIEITDSDDTEDGSDSDDDGDDEENNNDEPTISDTNEDVTDIGETDEVSQSAAYSGARGSGASTSSSHVKDSTPNTADFPISKGFFFAGGLLLLGFAILLLGRSHITLNDSGDKYDDSLD